jgi:diphosphomevalonate decarboxylase
MKNEKVTIKAGADIAFIKYWGKKDEKLRLPMNGSISMVLDNLNTTTTVEFRDNLTRDEISIEGESEGLEERRIVEHLERIRELGGVRKFAKVVSINNFPRATGLSSSGSGFAALTVAACKSLGLGLTRREMSILARQESGTACRCVCGGFVEWKDGKTSQTSYSKTIYPSDHWDLRDLIVIVDEGRKKISSTEGHKNATSSLFYRERQRRIKKKISLVKNYIEKRRFKDFGELIEAEALEFHAILLTSKPAHIAWHPGTIEVMDKVTALREQGLGVYFTINTGFNLHVITLPKQEERVRDGLVRLKSVKKIITAKVGTGPEKLNEHLF